MKLLYVLLEIIPGKLPKLRLLSLVLNDDLENNPTVDALMELLIVEVGERL